MPKKKNATNQVENLKREQILETHKRKTEVLGLAIKCRRAFLEQMRHWAEILGLSQTEIRLFCQTFLASRPAPTFPTEDSGTITVSLFFTQENLDEMTAWKIEAIFRDYSVRPKCEEDRVVFVLRFREWDEKIRPAGIVSFPEYCRCAGLLLKEGRPKRTNTRWTKKKTKEAKRLYLDGKTESEIADMLNLNLNPGESKFTDGAIRGIRKRDSWRRKTS